MGVRYLVVPELSGSNISVRFFYIKPPLSGDFCMKVIRDILCYFFAVIFEQLCSALKSSIISYKPPPQQDILLE